MDRSILIVSTFMMAVAVFLLTDERFLFKSNLKNSGSPVIAEIISSRNDVRHKQDQEIAWTPVLDRELVRDQDSIFAGQSSQAEVRFVSGSSLMIFANSLVTVDSSNQEAYINVRKGSTSLHLGANQKSKIKIGNVFHEITGNDSTIRILKQNNGQSSISVLGGADVQIKGASGSSTIRKNESAELSSDGKITEVKHFEVELDQPINDSVFWSITPRDLEFRWKQIADGVSYKLELSEDEDFSTILKSMETKNSSLVIKAFSNQGDFYWRVKALSLNGEEKGRSVAYRVSVLAEVSPKTILPENNAKLYCPIIQSFSEKSGKLVLLQWEDDSNASNFILEISQKADFSSNVTKKKVQISSFETEKLSPGDYYWRVKVSDEGRTDSSWSDTSQFSIIEKNVPFTSALLSPRDHERLYLSSAKFHFEWEPLLSTQEYLLEVAKDLAFKTIVKKMNTATPTLDLKINEQGLYYWRVSAKAKNGVMSEFSETRKFEVKESAKIILSKQLDQGIIWRKPGDKQRFEWQSSEPHAKYVYEISQTEDFIKPVFRKEVTGNSIEVADLPLKGRYFWRVIADQNYESSVQQVIFKTSEAVTLLTPLDGQVSWFSWQTDLRNHKNNEPLVLSGGSNVVLNWRDSNHSEKQHIQIAKDSEFKVLLVDQVIKENEYNSETLNAGDYFWRARAEVSAQNELQWSETRSFKVAGRFLDYPPQILKPEQNEQLMSKEIPANIKFNWSKRKGAERYELILSNEKNFSGDAVIRKIISGSESIEIPIQVYGQYFWQIRAITVEGVVTDFGPVFKFEVMKTPKKKKLEAPKMQDKQLDFEVMLEKVFSFFISSAMAEESPRAPVLHWDEIKGADKYVIQISTEKSFVKTIFEGDVKLPTFKWGNSKPGNYFWRVAAVDDEGQRGDFSEPGLIHISIPPTQIKGKSDQVLVKQITSLEDLKSSTSSIEINWEADSRAIGYRVQVGTDPNFKNAKVFETDQTSMTIKVIKDEKNYWRVAPLGENKATIGHYSNPGTVIIENQFTLKAPEVEKVLVKDEEITKSVPPKKSSQLSFSWVGDELASLYRFEVATDEQFKSIFYTETSVPTKISKRIEFPDEIPEDVIYVRVRAENGKSVSSWSNVSSAHTSGILHLLAHERVGLDLFGGIMLMNLAETDKTTKKTQIKSITLSARAELRHSFKGAWDYWAAAYLDGIAVQKTIFLTTISFSGGFGYVMSPDLKAWSLSLDGGAFFKYTFLATDGLGFKGVGGPVLGLSYRKSLSVQTKGLAYLKFSPAILGAQSSLAKGELDIGARYTFGLNQLIPITLGVEYAHVDMTTSISEVIQSDSALLSFGFEW